MDTERLIAEKYKGLRPVLNEQSRRRWAAAEALALGRGGISAVARATGLSRPTIRDGIGEIRRGQVPAAHENGRPRLRRPGGGRKPRILHEPTLLPDLEALVEPTTRGDPQSPLRWTSKGVRRLAAELRARGHEVGFVVCGKTAGSRFSSEATGRVWGAF